MNLMLKRKIFIILQIIAIIILTPVNVSAAGNLAATSPSVNVLELPTPSIENINPATGIVTLSLPDIDTDIDVDLHAVVTLLDSKGAVLEIAPEVKVLDPHSIKVPLRTSMKLGDIVSPEIKNNSFITGGDNDYVKAPDNEAPDNEAPDNNSSSGINSGSSSKGKTKYVIITSTPETITVEKLVEIEVPVEAEKVMPPVSGENSSNENISKYVQDGLKAIEDDPDIADKINKIMSSPTNNIEANTNNYNGSLYAKWLLRINILILVFIFIVLLIWCIVKLVPEDYKKKQIDDRGE